jgi:DNA-binding transcriptional MerR regulator
MRIVEIARLAGVTVRTLRHYHQIGLLPEPRRSSNGYRDYTAVDLTTVLRIRRLAGLGLSLDSVKELVERPVGTPDHAVLDDLDRELEDRIAHLAAQRAALARAKESALLDGAPEYLSLLDGGVGYQDATAEARTLDADLSLLVTVVGGAAGKELLGAVGRILDDPELTRRAARATEGFVSLDDGTPAGDRERVADDLVTAARPVRPGPALADRRLAALLDDYSRHALNDAQRDVLALAAERIQGPAPQPAG